MRLATRVGLARPQVAGVPPAFDLAARALTSWYQPNFTGSPWTPTASAGTSGANGNLAEATNPPATSAALNGLTGANFDGTNDQLSNATIMSDLLDNAAGSIAVFFHADTAHVDGGEAAYYTASALFTDDTNGFLCLSFNAAGCRLGCFNGANFHAVTAACGTGAPHVVMARWSSGTGNIEIRVDSGAWQVLSRSVVMSGGDGNRTGANYNAAELFDGVIYERFTEKARWSDAEADEIKDYLNTKYATAL